MEKFVPLLDSADILSFNHLYNPNNEKDHHKWLSDLMSGDLYSRYQQYLQNIVAKYHFEPLEVESLEMYLFHGGEVIISNGKERLQAEKESNTVIKNSQWDTPYAFQKIKEKRDDGWTYKKIVEYFQKLAPDRYKSSITSARIRQIYSRGSRKLIS